MSVDVSSFVGDSDLTDCRGRVLLCDRPLPLHSSPTSSVVLRGVTGLPLGCPALSAVTVPPGTGGLISVVDTQMYPHPLSY